jgi:hypothetical protein
MTKGVHGVLLPAHGRNPLPTPELDFALVDPLLDVG